MPQDGSPGRLVGSGTWTSFRLWSVGCVADAMKKRKPSIVATSVPALDAASMHVLQIAATDEAWEAGDLKYERIVHQLAARGLLKRKVCRSLYLPMPQRYVYRITKAGRAELARSQQ